MKKRSNKGFTLIELMIVVAIIGILAAIAIPKFADLISKSKEGATKGGLSAVRSSLQVYYGDNEGIFPSDTLTVLTDDGKYINEIPVAKLPGTGVGDSSDVTAYSSKTATAYLPTDIAATVGGWAYANDSSVNNSWGNFGVATTALDLKDISWTTY
ncbi:MAG: prepilin-type N-terminal cleavage/methylation domain-containing protein [Elusimicrobia bacterium]|nr:prepilin-type N-terminal cleavage/methylation domain-containing protein [Elusimicrobiota bacterium]